MNEIDPSLLIGGLVIFVLIGIPIYNFFADRAKEKKEESNVLHARINRLVEDTQFIKGFLKGKFDVDSD